MGVDKLKVSKHNDISKTGVTRLLDIFLKVFYIILNLCGSTDTIVINSARVRFDLAEPTLLYRVLI